MTSRPLSGVIFLTALALILAIPASPLHAQFSQEGGKLVGTGATGTLVYQGMSVAVSSDGNTALVGATRDNGSTGAVWVFTRSGTTWTQQGNKLVGTGATGTTVYQGAAVALSSDGNTAIVGAFGDNSEAGAAWIFTRTGSTWAQQGTKLVGTGGSGVGRKGTSVCISADGNTALVGGPYDNSYKGAAWVFTRSGTTWSQQGSKLVGTGATATSVQGSSVAVSADGNTAIIGGSGDAGAIGSAWVFTRSGGIWSQQGPKLVGTGYTGASNQGSAVSISADGNTALIGGMGDNGYAGAIWIFGRTGGTWTQVGTKLVGSGAVGIAQQGFSVALSGDGNCAVAGGYRDNSYVGAVWVFTRSGSTWGQLGSKLVGAGAVGGPQQGVSVGLSYDGSTAIVGGPIDNTNAGAAWVYHNPATAVDETGTLPEAFRLEQNYPNPFNPSTTITFSLSKESIVRLAVYDLLGKVIAVLTNDQRPAGQYSAVWNATEKSGIPAGTGVYFCRLEAQPLDGSDAFVDVRKMLILR